MKWKKCVPSYVHGAAADMFDKCLQWLEHQPEASLYNVTTLFELRSLAVTKSCNQ